VARGIACERAIFGGAPAWIDLERAKLAALQKRSNEHREQTNIKRINHPAWCNVETYVEIGAEWRTKFLTSAMDRRERLENAELSIEELIEESEDQLLEAFAYFLCLSPEQQQRTAQQFKDGLERVQKS
jgi:hypothetical protein